MHLELGRLRAGDAETIRLQAEEHPLVGDGPPASAQEHCQRLMHLRAYEEAAAHAAGRDVLDVGCNTGWRTLRFLPIARSVTGTDVSSRAIDVARSHARDGQPRFVLTSGAELPFPDASFDLVTSFQVLEHVADPIAFLEELRRVARAGATIVLSTPNAATRLDPGMTPWNRFHVREYTASELQELLERVFPRVRLRGMFGAATLYETEIRRVDAGRRRMRRLAGAEATRLAAAEGPSTRGSAPSLPVGRARPRSRARRWARRVLPKPAWRWIRSHFWPPRGNGPNAPAARAEPAAPAMDLETFLQFTVDDLFYADHDLDRAMDLLAICEVLSTDG